MARKTGVVPLIHVRVNKYISNGLNLALSKNRRTLKHGHLFPVQPGIAWRHFLATVFGAFPKY